MHYYICCIFLYSSITVAETKRILLPKEFLFQNERNNSIHKYFDQRSIETRKCYDQLEACRASKCSNCTSFIDCCTENCLNYSRKNSTQAAPFFVCENNGDLLDCKCGTECLEDAMQFVRSNGTSQSDFA